MFAQYNPLKLLNTKQRRLLRKLFVDFSYPVLGYSLTNLAKLCGTDKAGFHEYTHLYELHFNHMRWKRIKLLEIGVGGYDNPDYGGNSLRMWMRYFSRGYIYGIDIHDKSNFEEKRIRIFQGDQKDEKFIKKVIIEMGYTDIIIDDGSHINKDIIKSFEILFPYLKSGGIYVIEDTQTSYIDSYGGDSQNISNPKTTMNYFKKLIDCVNSKEFDSKIMPLPSHLNNIKEIHFYHNLIFIFKL